jgi:hypothetical protein
MSERMSDTIAIDQERIGERIEFMELGEAAQGAIEAGPNQQERLQEITERLGRGEFHTEIDWNVDQEMLLARCVDGRIPKDGANPLAPNSAGGTESIFVADDLTTKRYAAKDGSTLGGYANVTKALSLKGYAVGGHTDSHAHGEKSGCGANDKLPAIYQYMAENGDLLQALAEKLGVDVSDDTKETLVRNAAARGQFSEGAELLGVLKENADEKFVD